MIQTDRALMRNWCGCVARDVTLLADVVSDEKAQPFFVETVAYEFARMALGNLARLSMDENVSAQLVYYAAQGLIKGAADGLAALEPEKLKIDDTRKN